MINKGAVKFMGHEKTVNLRDIESSKRSISLHHPPLIFVLKEAIMDRFIYAQKTGAVNDD